MVKILSCLTSKESIFIQIGSSLVNVLSPISIYPFHPYNILILSEINCKINSFIHRFRDTYFECAFSCLFILRLNYAVKLFCRANYWYINIYNLGLNTVLNIMLPITSLVILNILIFKYVNPFRRSLGGQKNGLCQK